MQPWNGYSFFHCYVHTSIIAIATVGFDQLAQIRYLERYTKIVTRKRVVIFFINIGIQSVFQAVPFLFRSQYNSLGTSRKAAEAIDILIVPFIAFVYLY